MECPYCGETDILPVRISRETLETGKVWYDVCCRKCSGALTVKMQYEVVIKHVEASDFDFDDYGHRSSNNSETVHHSEHSKETLQTFRNMMLDSWKAFEDPDPDFKSSLASAACARLFGLPLVKNDKPKKSKLKKKVGE